MIWASRALSLHADPGFHPVLASRRIFNTPSSLWSGRAQAQRKLRALQINDRASLSKIKKTPNANTDESNALNPRKHSTSLG